jgi:hypothetical protein
MPSSPEAAGVLQQAQAARAASANILQNARSPSLDFGTGDALEASYAGDLPDNALPFDSTELGELQNQRLARSSANQVRQNLITNPGAYTQMNHGLQALPHIQNDD